MKKMLILINVLMKNTQNVSFRGRRANSKSSSGMVILYAFLLLYFGGLAVGLTYFLYSSLKPVNQEGLVITLILVLVTIITLIFSIFSCINVFYLSSDLEYILPLPLKPHEILLGKFAVLTIYNYIFEFALAIPSFVAYGIWNHESILFYLYFMVILILLPIIPLIIASLIVMILMSFVNITKHRDKFVIFISAFAIIFAILINVFSSKIVPTDESSVMVMIQKVNSLAIMFGKAFPFVLPSINCLVNATTLSAFLNFLLYILINICCVLLFALIGNAIYFKGALGSKENVSKKKVLTDSEIDKETASRGQLFTFVMKEWKLLYRNPTYLMQCIAPIFIFPILFLVIFRFNSAYSQLYSMLSQWPNLFGDPIAFTVLICVLTFFLIGNTSSGSAVSRDGRYATIAKYIPMDFYKQFIGKMLLGCIFSFVEVVLTMIVFSGPLNLSIYSAIVVTLIMIFIGIVQNYIMLIIDLKRPKLIWDNEMSVVKNNMNIFIDMIFLLVDMIIVIGTGFLFKLLSKIIGTNMIIILLTIALMVIHIIIWFILDLYVRKNKVKLFSSIE